MFYKLYIYIVCGVMTDGTKKYNETMKRDVMRDDVNVMCV